LSNAAVTHLTIWCSKFFTTNDQIGENMNIRRVQGLALIIGAVCLLFAIFTPDAIARLLGVLGALLLIFGIPAVNTSQPSGPVGLIGVILIILAAVIALGFSVGIFGDTGMEDALIATSAISGLAGRIITGWLTIKKQVFLHWLGWALIAGGVPMLAGLIDLGSPAISTVFMLLESAALAGYGIQIFQKNLSNSKVGLGSQPS
jgi:hypothetical protein